MTRLAVLKLCFVWCADKAVNGYKQPLYPVQAVNDGLLLSIIIIIIISLIIYVMCSSYAEIRWHFQRLISL